MRHFQSLLETNNSFLPHGTHHISRIKTFIQHVLKEPFVQDNTEGESTKEKYVGGKIS